MKKTLVALCLTLAFGSAKAANFVSFDVDQVKDTTNGAKSTAQYFRAGKDMAGLNLGVQVRTAVFDKGGMLNSVEVTAGKDIIKGLNTYLGVGYDNGFDRYRDWETDRKSTRLNSSHSRASRMPSSA